MIQEQPQKSKGRCHFCGKTYAKAGINRHLKTHLTALAAQQPPGKSALVKVGTDPRWGSTPYFLSLWVDGETTFKYLDDFLRAIWLECCGHLSAFTDPKRATMPYFGMDVFFEGEELLEQGKQEEYDALMERAKGDIPMGRTTQEVFHKGQKIQYRYDFGSTTELLLEVLDVYPCKAQTPLVLLSRNEPLEFPCESCGKKRATQICTGCEWNMAEAYFCPNCMDQHAKTCEAYQDYGSMPLANSPRAGVCGYTGGTIDLQRDGILSVTT